MTRERISIEDPGKPRWRCPPVARLRGVRLRRLGMRAVPEGWGALLRTRSVHTFGMRDPLGIVCMGGDFVVRRSIVVRPRRVVVDLGATWILELPGGHPLPADGSSLRILPS